MSNATRTHGTKIINATATGNKFNQHRSTNWSYRSLGRVALNQTNIKQNTQVFRPRIIAWKLRTVSFTKISGRRYPPKNKIAVKVLMSTILQYSARKKNTKIMEECSVKNPLTSSDSLSGRSNGVRFVSASALIKKSIVTGKSGILNQTALWLSIIVVIFKDPLRKTTLRIVELKISS